MTKEIQHRIDKVKGTWTVGLMPDASDDGSTYPYVSVREGHGCDIEQIFSENDDEGHIDFIAHAPADIKWLLGKVKRVKKCKELVEFLSYQDCLMEAEGSSKKIECRKTENCITEMCFPCQAKLTLKALGDNHG